MEHELRHLMAKDIFWTFTILGGLIIAGGLFLAAHMMSSDIHTAGVIARLSGIGGGLTYTVGLATKLMFEVLAQL